MAETAVKEKNKTNGDRVRALEESYIEIEKVIMDCRKVRWYTKE